MCSYKISSRNAVKFFSSELSDTAVREELLNVVSESVSADHILAAMQKDGVLKIYLATAEDTKCLLSHGIKFKGQHLLAYPLIRAFTVKNVPPTVQDNELSNFFSSYGGVIEIETVPFCPDSNKFSHVLGSERRIFLEIAKWECSYTMPKSVAFLYCGSSISFSVTDFCILCDTEGHKFDSCRKIKVKPESNNPSANADAPLESTTNLPSGSNESPIYIPSEAFQYIPSSEINNKESSDDSPKKTSKKGLTSTTKARRRLLRFDSNSWMSSSSSTSSKDSEHPNLKHSKTQTKKRRLILKTSD